MKVYNILHDQMNEEARKRQEAEDQLKEEEEKRKERKRMKKEMMKNSKTGIIMQPVRWLIAVHNFVLFITLFRLLVDRFLAYRIIGAHD